MGSTRELAATAGALGAYGTTVLPRARREQRRWRKLAQAIPDPVRRREALASLDQKAANVEAVAVFATLAPLRRRRQVLRAIVPLQLAIDLSDTLEEAGRRDDHLGEDSYLAALHEAWTREVERLPGYDAVARLLHLAVERCADGQRQTHAAAADDVDSLRRWAKGLAPAAEYRWWEIAAGASSSVAAHALIAAAADARTTGDDAERIDRAYHPSIGALTVFLDDLVDRDLDLAAGEHNYLAYYADAAEAAARLGAIANQATALVAGLPRPSRHAAILAGVAGFYLSAGEARGSYAAPIRECLLTTLGPAARMISSWMRMRRLKLRP